MEREIVIALIGGVALIMAIIGARWMSGTRTGSDKPARQSEELDERSIRMMMDGFADTRDLFDTYAELLTDPKQIEVLPMTHISLMAGKVADFIAQGFTRSQVTAGLLTVVKDREVAFALVETAVSNRKDALVSYHSTREHMKRVVRGGGRIVNVEPGKSPFTRHKKSDEKKSNEKKPDKVKVSIATLSSGLEDIAALTKQALERDKSLREQDRINLFVTVIVTAVHNMLEGGISKNDLRLAFISAFPNEGGESFFETVVKMSKNEKLVQAGRQTIMKHDIKVGA